MGGEPMIIKLVRHGRSVGNEDSNEYVLKPDHEIELNEEGKQQAKNLAHDEDMFELYRSELLQHVYCSPFMRTRQTMELCFEEMGLQKTMTYRGPKIWFDHRLREQSWGRPLNTQQHMEFFNIHFNNKYWGKTAISESGVMVMDRVHSFLDRVESKGKDCLVFTHGVTINAFIAIVKGYSIEAFENMGYVRNCSITTLEI
jgi:broad specificity phosphatase PhoE